MIICGACGKDSVVPLPICGYCGSRLEGTRLTPTLDKTLRQPKKARGKAAWISLALMVLGVLLVASAAGLVFLGFSNLIA